MECFCGENPEDLTSTKKERVVVIVGAGISLDNFFPRMEEILSLNPLFLLADSIASVFIRHFPQVPRVVFSVEQRRHTYLKSLSGEKIFFYCGGERRNLPEEKRNNKVSYFSLKGSLESCPLQFSSPGTVAGIAFAYALHVLDIESPASIIFAGLDFSYPENRIYSRAISYSHLFNRLKVRESHEYVAVLSKSAYGIIREEKMLRTSAEFQVARENFRTIIDQLPDSISLFDMSSVGITSPRITKIFPD